jgi:hypothetical protein
MSRLRLTANSALALAVASVREAVNDAAARTPEPALVISGYTRAQGIADGVLFDAMAPELAEVTRQHWPSWAAQRLGVAMTDGVHALLGRAVANKRWRHDWKGLWHDVLWISRRAVGRAIQKAIASGHGERVEFQMVITGVGRQRYQWLSVHVGPGDDGMPVLTFLLPDED